MGFWKFLQYHNAVPIAFSIAVLGAGGVFAATNPESIYGATQRVLSIDNSYIAYKDLASYSPQVSISGVTEDDEYYYVAYDFRTIDVRDYVWQDVINKEVMRVSKADLGPYRDLGLYVMEQLKQKIDREIAYLREVQDIEKRQISQKMVATAYSGLIGQFLDENTETLPNYTPVVVPPKPPEPEPVVVVNEPTNTQTQPSEPQQQTPPAQTGQPSTPTPSGPTPTMQVLGESMVRVEQGSPYTDLGAVITGPTDTERALTIHVFVNGTDVQKVEINTAEVGEWKISYQVFHEGTVTAVERQVIVYAPEPEPAPEETLEQASSTPPAPPEEEPEEEVPPAEETPPVEEAQAPVEVVQETPVEGE